jgi:hypothetical protein
MIEALLTGLARPWPIPVSASTDLETALAYLDISVDGATVCKASYTVASICGLATLVLSAVPTIPILALVPLGILSLLVLVAGPLVPELIATAKRTRSLGAAPALISRATLSMSLSPAPERAAAFAAAGGQGPLARSLAAHVRRANGTARTGFDGFGTEWEAWLPEITRSVSLIERAGVVPADEREATLDRARRTVIEATRDKMAAFAAAIRGPATALYAFGVLLPLALVSMLPAVRATGIDMPLAAIVLLYDLLLPVGLVCAGAWLVVRRPVAFPPPALDRSHPAMPTRRWPPLVGGLAAGSGAAVVAMQIFPPWSPPLAGVGLGVGTALILQYRPAVAIREEISAVEDGLGDALSRIGRQVSQGIAVETAIETAAAEMPAATGDLLTAVTRRQATLGLGVDAAFAGPHGALDTVHSHRITGAAALLGRAATAGQLAGTTLTAMAEHLDDLADLEAAANRSVEQVTSTLANTATVFGPLVGGATVSLAGAMGSAGPLTGATATGGLGLAVGVYVLTLAVVLTALSISLRRGFERSLVGYRVGVALVAATTVYLTASLGTALVV